MELKQYFKTVADRLNHTFAMDEFGMTDEVEFWALGSDLVTQETPPFLENIVEWLDRLYHAPLHVIYRKETDEKLMLFRRHVVVDNISRLLKSDDAASQSADTKQRKIFVEQFEDQINYLESQLKWKEDFKATGELRLSVGRCIHIPLMQGQEFWGIYVVGPYITHPHAIESKMRILCRMLSRLVIQLAETDSDPRQKPQGHAETLRHRLNSDGLNSEGTIQLLLPFIRQLTGAQYSMIIETINNQTSVIASDGVSEDITLLFTGDFSEIPVIADHNHQQVVIKDTFLDDHPTMEPSYIQSFKNSRGHGYLLLGVDQSTLSPDLNNVLDVIVHSVGLLIGYRDRKQEISTHLIDTYFTMIRALELQQDQTRYHTLRMIAFAEKFAELFSLSEQEQEILIQTVKLHDIGYAGTMDLNIHLTIDEALGHPLLGATMVDTLPIASDIKEGIKTHHEWVNGSGTPNGLKWDDIPWTGKIVGILEFIVEYIEEHYEDPEENIVMFNLLNELIDRTDKQFDMMLISTVIELLQTMEWADCRSLGEPTNEAAP